MTVETAHEILRWATAGLAGAIVLCLVADLILRESVKKTGLKFIWAALIFACLALPTALVMGVLESKMLPQCPNCEQSVSSAYCPDCGWESAG